MESTTHIKVKCSNCGALIVDKFVQDRVPAESDYWPAGAIKIEAKHNSSVGVSNDLCCGTDCAESFLKSMYL